MAVKKYHRSFGLQLFLLFLGLQIIVGSALYAWHDTAQTTFGITHPFLQVAIPFLLFELIASLFILGFVLKPLTKIEKSVSYAARNSPTDQSSTENIDNLIKAIRHLEATHQNASASTEHTFSQSLLDHLPIGVIVLDEKQQIIYHNGAAPLHGGDKGINLDFAPNDSLDTWLKTIKERDISAHKWWKRLREVKPVNEDEPQFYDALALYRQDGDEHIESILVTINHTEKYGMDETELDFISLAAHELRGPVTVIRGYLDVLRHELDTTLNDDQKAFFERLDVSADRLTTYINNILNVSRYDRHHLQLHLKEEKLTTVYNTVADDLALRAKTLHRLLNVSIPDNLPTIAADRGSLSEVIVNLVDNAIKYSSEGGLVVVSAEAKNDVVEVTVKDSGIGIPASLVSHVFDKFYRSHRSRENTVGTGLGLYITRAIVESHGGTITVRSEEGHGSIFSFSIPIYATVADKLQANNSSNESMIKSKKYIKNHSLYRG